MDSYRHPDNQDIPFRDWRKKKYRKEVFFKFMNWKLQSRSVDHFTWNQGYMDTEKSPTGEPMNREQRFWFSFLFGMTYQSSMAWIHYWNHPNHQEIDVDELDEWNRETVHRQKYAKDTRYNLGRIVPMFESIRAWLNDRGDGTFEGTLENLLRDNEYQSFHNIFNEITENLHRYGRMCSWLTTQCLAECTDLPIEADTMFSDHSGNWSVWNGIMFLRGSDHMTVGNTDKYSGYSPTEEDKKEVLKWEDKLLEESKKKAEEQLDPEDRQYLSFFTLETCLCQYKKLYVGGQYPGQCMGDAIDRWKHLSKKWPEVDFSAFEGVTEEHVSDSVLWKSESRELLSLFEKTGQFIHMSDMYPELPNMYKELKLDEDILKMDRYEGNHTEKIIKDRIDQYSTSVSGGVSSSHIFNSLDLIED
jgi:hypothetical protein